MSYRVSINHSKPLFSKTTKTSKVTKDCSVELVDGLQGTCHNKKNPSDDYIVRLDTGEQIKTILIPANPDFVQDDRWQVGVFQQCNDYIYAGTDEIVSTLSPSDQMMLVTRIEQIVADPSITTAQKALIRTMTQSHPDIFDQVRVRRAQEWEEMQDAVEDVDMIAWIDKLRDDMYESSLLVGQMITSYESMKASLSATQKKLLQYKKDKNLYEVCQVAKESCQETNVAAIEQLKTRYQQSIQEMETMYDERSNLYRRRDGIMDHIKMLHQTQSKRTTLQQKYDTLTPRAQKRADKYLAKVQHNYGDSESLSAMIRLQEQRKQQMDTQMYKLKKKIKQSKTDRKKMGNQLCQYSPEAQQSLESIQETKKNAHKLRSKLRDLSRKRRREESQYDKIIKQKDTIKDLHEKIKLLSAFTLSHKSIKRIKPHTYDPEWKKLAADIERYLTAKKTIENLNHQLEKFNHTPATTAVKTIAQRQRKRNKLMKERDSYTSQMHELEKSIQIIRESLESMSQRQLQEAQKHKGVSKYYQSLIAIDLAKQSQHLAQKKYKKATKEREEYKKTIGLTLVEQKISRIKKKSAKNKIYDDLIATKKQLEEKANPARKLYHSASEHLSLSEQSYDDAIQAWNDIGKSRKQKIESTKLAIQENTQKLSVQESHITKSYADMIKALKSETQQSIVDRTRHLTPEYMSKVNNEYEYLSTLEMEQQASLDQQSTNVYSIAHEMIVKSKDALIYLQNTIYWMQRLTDYDAMQPDNSPQYTQAHERLAHQLMVRQNILQETVGSVIDSIDMIPSSIRDSSLRDRKGLYQYIQQQYEESVREYREKSVEVGQMLGDVTILQRMYTDQQLAISQYKESQVPDLIDQRSSLQESMNRNQQRKEYLTSIVEIIHKIQKESGEMVKEIAGVIHHEKGVVDSDPVTISDCHSRRKQIMTIKEALGTQRVFDQLRVYLDQLGQRLIELEAVSDDTDELDERVRQIVIDSQRISAWIDQTLSNSLAEIDQCEQRILHDTGKYSDTIATIESSTVAIPAAMTDAQDSYQLQLVNYSDKLKMLQDQLQYAHNQMRVDQEMVYDIIPDWRNDRIREQHHSQLRSEQNDLQEQLTFLQNAKASQSPRDSKNTKLIGEIQKVRHRLKKLDKKLS